jgi:vacuolar-type H+-ATPase subunit H
MDTEKTLLQQIRDKEQELAQKVEAIRLEADASVAAARTEAEDLLCTADTAGKKTAEEVYWKERGRTEMEIAALKQAAERDREAASVQGTKNVPAAADRIVSYVTME